MRFLGIVPAASADPLPVIAVNREIGLSALGTFTDIEHRYSDRYTFRESYPLFSGGQAVSSYTNNTYQRARGNSWTPGFEANAQVMFDIGRIKHLYASGNFDLGDGNEHDQSAETSVSSYGTYGGRSQGNRNRSYTNSWGEIGKGFLLNGGRLLITPVIQGGYYSYGPRYSVSYPASFPVFTTPLPSGTPQYIAHDRFSVFGNGYVGLAVHADYALTNALVLRGRAGWAQMLDTHSSTIGPTPIMGPRARYGRAISDWITGSRAIFISQAGFAIPTLTSDVPGNCPRQTTICRISVSPAVKRSARPVGSTASTCVWV